MSMSVAPYDELKTVPYGSRKTSMPTGKTLGKQGLPSKRRSSSSLTAHAAHPHSPLLKRSTVVPLQDVERKAPLDYLPAYDLLASHGGHPLRPRFAARQPHRAQARKPARTHARQAGRARGAALHRAPPMRERALITAHHRWIPLDRGGTSGEIFLGAGVLRLPALGSHAQSAPLDRGGTGGCYTPQKM